MKVYHGSLEVVAHPRILQPNRRLDYGMGFYATTSERQAREWAGRRMTEKRIDSGFVNVYEFDENKSKELKCLIFKEPNNECVEFVMANRTQKNFTHGFDIVYGPVANDRVYLQFGLYESGAISIETLIHELKTYKLVDQYLFHTTKSLLALRFLRAAII